MHGGVSHGKALWLSKAASALKELGASVLDFCFPRVCAGCRSVAVVSRNGFWCDECLESLPWIEPPFCSCCGIPFHDSPSSPGHLCGECLRGSHQFDSARAATLYAGVVRQRIHQLKFGQQLHWVPPLVELLLETVEEQGVFHADLVLPVPLHRRRLRQRGFNQSGLLAKMLGKRLGIPVQFDLLVRKNWTEPQTRLNRKERLENVRGAFDVPRPSMLEGRCIVLVDDVLTTGTTINECAKILRSSGASEIHTVTICRALPDRKLVGEHSKRVG